MAVTIIFGDGERERRFEVAPFKLRQLRLIAPFIEQMNDVAKRIDKTQREAKKEALAAGMTDPEVVKAANEAVSLEDLFALSRTLCEIIAVGVSKVDPSVTADVLEDEIDLSYLSSLQEGVRELLKQSGLSSAGEKKAPSPTPDATGPKPEPEAASQNSLEGSSAS